MLNKAFKKIVFKQVISTKLKFFCEFKDEIKDYYNFKCSKLNLELKIK